MPRALFGARRPRPRVLLLPPGGAPARGRDALPRGAGGGSHHLARPRLRPERAVGAGSARDARARRRVLPQRGRVARALGKRRPRRGGAALQEGQDEIIAKFGAQGALALDGDGKAVRVPAPRVTVVDTTGAGDSFDAGFLHAWLSGAPLADCLRLGATCGSLSTRGLGGTATQPDLAEARRFEWRRRDEREASDGSPGTRPRERARRLAGSRADADTRASAEQGPEDLPEGDCFSPGIDREPTRRPPDADREVPRSGGRRPQPRLRGDEASRSPTGSR